MQKQHPTILRTKLHHVSIKSVFYTDILKKPSIYMCMTDLLIYPSYLSLTIRSSNCLYASILSNSLHWEYNAIKLYKLP